MYTSACLCPADGLADDGGTDIAVVLEPEVVVEFAVNEGSVDSVLFSVVTVVGPAVMVSVGIVIFR